MPCWYHGPSYGTASPSLFSSGRGRVELLPRGETVACCATGFEPRDHATGTLPGRRRARTQPPPCPADAGGRGVAAGNRAAAATRGRIDSPRAPHGRGRGRG